MSVVTKMISYDDALANLMAMFPDMETDTISAVLRQQGGHMERTIDALLVMFVACSPLLLWLRLAFRAHLCVCLCVCDVVTGEGRLR